MQLRLLVQRGEHRQKAVPDAEAIVARARESAEPQMISMALAAAAELLLAQVRPEQAKALLAELEQLADTRDDVYYASLLPELVRTTLALGDAELAARLVARVEARTPLSADSLTACRAQIAEAAGRQAEAAELFTESARRWREFGNVPERAYALLGRGRCLVALSKPGQRSRFARRATCSHRWDTSPRSPRPKPCSARARPPSSEHDRKKRDQSATNRELVRCSLIVVHHAVSSPRVDFRVRHPFLRIRDVLGHPASAGSFISGYGSERIAARSESQRCVRPDSVTVMVEAAVGVQLACMRWHSRPAGVTAVYAHM